MTIGEVDRATIEDKLAVGGAGGVKLGIKETAMELHDGVQGATVMLDLW
jgi:hypothetical protein